ncbi:hypothetical protein L1987_37123 [Smallanthus sonchifolius]|uniref:Uncharacterized protein n=1 Tax=Smallanthus sonchifolius TaxID=185202 RepID=A0ACB9HGR5_9ASTR|nr:hypothetical protein L1987_37123 [Smallanthus sonchifolius]
MRHFIGIIKDNLTLSKLTLFSNPTTSYLHIAVLRTTSHSPSTPPNDHHLATILSLGDSSRATASTIIHSLITRLHRTSNSLVALKCLLTIHHIIKRGPFILKDHLRTIRSTNGRNNLKLSSFRDGSSPATWALSAWVWWYACYIETILYTTKNMDFDIYSSLIEKEKRRDLILSCMNSDLIRDVGLLVGVIEEICKVPDNLLVEKDRLVRGVMELLGNDYLSMVNEILVRLSEFKERVGLLSFDDSVELASVLDRLTGCKEKLLRLFSVKKISVENLWEMIEELDRKIGVGGVSQLGLVTGL